METIRSDQSEGMGEDIRSGNSGIITQKGLLQIIDALPLAIAVIDQSRCVALANKAVLKFVHRPKSQIAGQVCGKAIGCAHHGGVPEGCGFGPHCTQCKLNETVKLTMQTKSPQSKVEAKMFLEFYGERWLLISTLPIALDGTEVVLLSIEDATEARRHEQIILQKEKLQGVLEMAGAICHEINQPLMSLSGYTELLLMDIQEERSHEYIGEIYRQAGRLGEITRKLMKITKYKTKKYLNGSIVDIDKASADNSDKEPHKT